MLEHQLRARMPVVRKMLGENGDAANGARGAGRRLASTGTRSPCRHRHRVGQSRCGILQVFREAGLLDQAPEPRPVP